VGKLQGQGLCGWPLCATRGSRHSRGVGLLPGSLCRFGRDPELLRGDLLHLVRSCSCLLGSRSQIGGRPHWLGCTQCFAGVYAEGPAPAAASASHRERSRSAGAPCFEFISLPSSSAHSAVPPRNRQFLRALGRRRSVCLLSEVACPDGALVRTKGAHTRLASSSIDDNLLDASRQRTPLLGAPAALLRACA